MNGEFNPYSYCKTGYFWSDKNGKLLHYRSSYELIVYKMFEVISKVVKYEVEVVVIPYKWADGSVHRYHVDILVWYDDGTKELIEVKPEYKLEDDLVRLKIEAGKNYAEQNDMKFSVWTENNFKEGF